MKLNALAATFRNELKGIYDSDEAEALFLLAIEHQLKLNRGAYLLNKEEEIPIEELSGLEEVLSALKTGKPIQYILEESYFYGLKFKVNPSVLIPRPETEELVDWILEKVSSYQFPMFNEHQTPKAEHLSILDIGTGSGCIAISLKKNIPAASVYALDISAAAIATAKGNALSNDVDVTFIQQDILTHSIFHFPTAVSVIVSNPPYIKLDEKPTMHHNVVAHEPAQALFVSNEKPLIFYEAIADFANENLVSGGLLFLEINEYLSKETLELLAYKEFVNIELRNDMQGKDRMICTRKP